MYNLNLKFQNSLFYQLPIIFDYKEQCKDPTDQNDYSVTITCLCTLWCQIRPSKGP